MPRRPLADLLIAVLTALAPGAAAAPEAADPFARWEPEIAAFEKADALQPPAKGGILFLGSSSIRLWTTLAQDFPRHRVINRGFGGSQIVDVTHFVDRIVFPYAPRQIVFYAGGNDLNAGKSAEQVAADFRGFVEAVRARLPEVPIAYLAIAGNPARWAQIDRVRAANGLLSAYCRTTPHLKFIDVHSRMLGPDGLPRKEIFVEDQLHMNAAGYRLWTELVGPHLAPEPGAATVRDDRTDPAP